jgi:hypothetical protein
MDLTVSLRGSLLVASAVLILAGGGNASADWQYTKWGMSPEQVIEASGGTATWLSRPDPPRAGRQILLKSTYTSGQLHFDVTFAFSLAAKQLAQVKLLLRDASAGALLRQSLIAKYGPPQGGGDSGEEIWRDEASNNLVSLRDLGIANVVLYKPLKTSEAGGL